MKIRFDSKVMWWVYLFMSVFIGAGVNAGTVLFEDNFDTGIDSTKWEREVTETGSQWISDNGTITATANPVNWDNRFTDITTVKNDFSDFTITWRWKFDSGGMDKDHVWTYFRCDNTYAPQINGYRVAADVDYPYDGHCYLGISGNDNGRFVLLAEVDLGLDYFSHTDWYTFKLQVYGNEFKVKFWKEGESEPANWLLTATDSTFVSGRIGFGNYWEAVTHVDNVRVESVCEDVWQAPQMLDTSKIYKALHSADMNGDGIDEIVAGSGSDGEGLGIEIWSYNQVNGVWTLNETITDLENDPHDIATGDFNKDGRMDVAVCMRWSGLKVFLNQGGGNWTPLYLDSQYGNSVEVADFDQDGNLDILFCPGGWESGYATIYYGDGAGQFTNGGGPQCPQSPGGCRFSIADINGDGFLDILGRSEEWENGSEPHVYFRAYLNEGNRTWSTSLVGNEFRDMSGSPDAAADVNGDGFIDCGMLASSSPASGYDTVCLLLGGEDSAGQFTWQRQDVAILGQDLDWINLCDVNADGHPDIVVPGRPALLGINVYYGDGQGHFSEPELLAEEYSLILRTEVKGDFNCDGQNDIVFSSLTTPGLGVILSHRTPILWNKLGSEYEVTHSEIGPSLTIKEGTYDLTFIEGKFGGAIQFPNTYGDGSVVHASSSILNKEKGCIEMWIKSPMNVVNGVVQSMPAEDWAIFWDTEWGHGSNSGWDYRGPNIYFGCGNLPHLNFSYLDGEQSPGTAHEMIYDTTSTYMAGDWVHIAAVWDVHKSIDGSKSMALYVNGTQVASSEADLNSEGPWDPEFALGGDIGGGQMFRNGAIDNVKIWNYAKTDFSDRCGLPTVTVTATDAVAGEPATGEGSGTFTFARSGSTAAPLTVNFTVTGTATSGSDYTSLGSMVTFAAGSATAVATVSVIDDNVVEGDETVVVTLASGSGYSVGIPSAATVTVKDDDATVTVSATDAIAGEPLTSQGNGTFTFSRAGFKASDLTVNFTVGGTATAGSDYASLGSAVTFAAGSATATKTVNVLNDSLVEGDETVGLTLASGTGYAIGNPASATVTIQDDDFSSSEIIVDNANATGVEITGAWMESTSTPGYWGINYIHDGNTGKGTKSITFRPTLPSAGNYEVSIRYTAGSNRATNAPVDIVYADGTRTVLVNERLNGGQWVVLGTNSFVGGTSGYVKIRTDNTSSGYVIADAVKFRPVGTREVIIDNADMTGVEVAGTWTGSTSTPGYWRTNYLHDGNTGKGTKSVTFRPTLPSAGNYEVSIWYTAGANRATNVPIDIVYSGGTRTVLVNERLNGGQWVVLGTHLFAGGTSGHVTIRTDNTSSGYVIVDAVRFRPVTVTEVIVDNADATGVEIAGTWIGSTSSTGYWPTNYIHDGNTGKGTKSVTFRPTLPSAGNYEVSIWYTAGSNRATNVPIDIVYSGGTRTVRVNERINGSKWVVLGTNSFMGGTSGSVKIRTDNTSSGYVIADAVRFKSIVTPQAPGNLRVVKVSR